MAKTKSIGLMQFINTVGANSRPYLYPTILMTKNLEIVITEEDERYIGERVEGTHIEYNEYIKNIIFNGEKVPYKYPNPQPFQKALTVKDFSNFIDKDFTTESNRIQFSPEGKVFADRVFSDITSNMGVLSDEAKKHFEKNMIEDAVREEQKVSQFFIQNYAVKDKKDIIKFLNSEDARSPQQLSADIKLISNHLYNALQGKPASQKTQDPSNFNRLLDIMKSNLIDGPQFIAELKSLEEYYTKNKQFLKAEEGIIRASKTFLEFLISSSIVSKLSTNSGIKVRGKNIGGQPSKNFLVYLEKTKDKDGNYYPDKAYEMLIDELSTVKSKTSNFTKAETLQTIKSLRKDKILSLPPKEFEKFFDSFINENFGLSRKLVSGGSSKDVADILLEFYVDDQEVFKIYSDAKMGLSYNKEKGTYLTRYTPSTGFTIEISKLKENLKKHRELINTILVFLVFNGLHDNLEMASKNQELLKIITYIIILGDDYVNYYKIEGSGIKNPAFMATAKGMMWYSDFYKLLYYTIFSGIEKNQTYSKFSSISYSFKEDSKEKGRFLYQEIDSTQKNSKSFFAQEFIRLKNIKDILSLINESTNLQAFHNNILSSKLNLSVDFEGLFERQEQADDLYKSIKNK